MQNANQTVSVLFSMVLLDLQSSMIEYKHL